MKMLHAKGMLAKSYIKKADPKRAAQNYGDNYQGVGGKMRPYKEGGAADAKYAQADNQYPMDYMKGTKDYKHGMGRAAKRILGKMKY